jgi:hypothetical protein
LNLDWRERYQLLGKIGSGGFAEVFEAHDRTLERRVALKIVPEGKGVTARIVREVSAAAALSHPNIVTLYDWFGDGERNYIVWELVDGESLDKMPQVPDPDVVAIGAELLEALTFAHSQGIVHRDVKPQNVMLDAEGHVKVMDFGIALLLDSDTLTRDGDVVGTVAYMSPEQAAGRRVGPSSDVYSAGMVLYELFAGAHPLRGETPAQTLSNVIAARLPSLATLRPDLPEELVELVDAACAVRAADRPSAATMAAELRGLLERGGLRSRRWRRAERLVEAAFRAVPLVERVGGATLATAVTFFVVRALAAYPATWTLPLVAVSAALWAVLPRAGLAWLLGVLAFPVFNVSLSLGVTYLVVALVAFLLARSRPVLVLWPALAVVLAPVYLVLLAPAGAAVLGRVRGPWTAAWAGAATLVYVALADAAGSEWLVVGDGLAAALTRADDPLAVAHVLVGALTEPVSLIYIGVWAGLAAAIGLAFVVRTLELRLWIWSLSFAAAYAIYAVVPVMAWGQTVSLLPLALNVAAAAGVILLPLALWAGGRPEEPDDEHLQGD